MIFVHKNMHPTLPSLRYAKEMNSDLQQESNGTQKGSNTSLHASLSSTTGVGYNG